MKTARFTDSQFIAILKHAEGNSPALELCREYGISDAILHKWRSKFNDMDASLMARITDGKSIRLCNVIDDKNREGLYFS